ncbi:hypothetical protein LTR92_007002 [Exophiala xenobiotica]|nr:hypothetical protein LTR92_007002 [Exophiala xenobiotica]
MGNPVAHTILVREIRDDNTNEPITPSVRVSLECAGLRLETELPSLVVIDGGFRELLRWYLEDFAVHDPFHSTKATRVSEKLKAYASALKSALLVEAIVPSPESVVNIAFQIHESEVDSEIFRNVVWEALELSQWTDGFLMLNSISVARVVPQLDQAQTKIDCQPLYPGSASTYNILAVSSRPKLVKDVQHRLITRPLLDIVENVNSKSGVSVILEIVRPATFEVLTRRLLENKASDYNILHLDVHGYLDDTGTYLSLVKGTSESLKEDLIPFEALLPSIKQARLSLVVLNACDSAVNGRVPSANIARRLTECGIPATVAMSYKILDDTAAIFTQALYSNLLDVGRSVPDSVHAARQMLISKSSRRTKFGTTVHVEDLVVPVLYHNNGCPEILPPTAGFSSPPQLSELADEPEFIGREEDMLILESHLLIHSPALQVTGEPGVGKTAMVNSISRWWKATGLIDMIAQIDMKAHDPWTQDSLRRDILNQCRIRRLPAPSASCDHNEQPKRGLVILEGFGMLRTARNKTEQSQVKGLIRELLNAKFFVIALSRQVEVWLRFQMNLSYGLSPLRDTEASTLGFSLLKQYGRSSESMEREDLQALDHVIRLAKGNPLAVKLVVHDFCNQMTEPALDPMDYHVNLLQGGRMKFDEIWMQKLSGCDAVFELRELFVLNYGPGDSRPLNPKFLLPFWDSLAVDDLTMYWLLTTWDWTPFENRSRLRGGSPYSSSLGVLQDLPGSRLRIIMDLYPGFRETFEYTEMVGRVAAMLRTFEKRHFIGERSLLNFEMAGQVVHLEYHRLHPLIPFVARQFDDFESVQVRQYCNRVIPIFYNYRMRSWPVWTHYKNSMWNVPKCVLGSEFNSFLAAAYITLALDPNIVNTSFMFWIFQVVQKGKLKDESRDFLLFEFWKRTTAKVLYDKEQYKESERLAGDAGFDQVLKILSPLLRAPTDWQLVLEAFSSGKPFESRTVSRNLVNILKSLPEVAIEMIAITALAAMRNVRSHDNPGSTAVYLSLMEKTYKERTIIPYIDLFAKPMFDFLMWTTRVAEQVSTNLRTLDTVMAENRSGHEIQPESESSEGNDDYPGAETVTSFFDAMAEAGMNKTGLGNSLSSGIENVILAQSASDKALEVGDTAGARVVLEKALLEETTQKNSSTAYNTSRLYYCLSRVAEKEKDYALALRHHRKGWEIEVGSGMEKTPVQEKAYERRMEKLVSLAEKARDGK